MDLNGNDHNHNEQEPPAFREVLRIFRRRKKAGCDEENALYAAFLPLYLSSYVAEMPSMLAMTQGLIHAAEAHGTEPNTAREAALLSIVSLCIGGLDLRDDDHCLASVGLTLLTRAARQRRGGDRERFAEAVRYALRRIDAEEN